MQHDFILLDRSGSMAGTMWTEALNGINAYVQKLAADNIDTGVTLVVFDGDEPFKVIRDRITPKTWKTVTNEDAMPRGMTPLNDGAMKLLDLAEQGFPGGGPYEKCAIVIVTDGAENASQEFSINSGGVEKVKNRLDKCRAKGWVVQFLGANFDNQAQAMSYGTTRGSTISASAANFGSTMSSLASKRGAYSTLDLATSGAAAATRSMDWTEEEKTKAAAPEKTS